MRPWFWRRKAREAELDEEVRAHLDMAAQTAIERGAAQKEAERAARREVGNMGLMKEVTRGVWGWRWLEDVVEEIGRASGRGRVEISVVAGSLKKKTEMKEDARNRRRKALTLEH